jgi:hypothetical protein
MATDEETQTNDVQPALPEDDAQKVVDLLKTAGESNVDLLEILTQPDADKLVDDIYRDEVHVQDA